MLKHRLLTALVLVPLLLLAIYLLPSLWFAVFVTLFMLVAAWEWTTLVGMRRTWARLLYLCLMILAFMSSYYISVICLLLLSLVFWLWASAAVFSYAKGFSALGFQYAWVKGLMGFVALTPGWLVTNALREEIGGPSWLLFAFALIVATDAGAYFAGRFHGKRTLIERVSPNKTWEGLWGGLLLAVIIALVVGLITQGFSIDALPFALLALVTGFFAIMGDLFESMLKRQMGVKDSGKLLPGHGGVLDRIDSPIAALPVFTLLSLWFLL